MNVATCERRVIQVACVFTHQLHAHGVEHRCLHPVVPNRAARTLAQDRFWASGRPSCQTMNSGGSPRGGPSPSLQRQTRVLHPQLAMNGDV